MNNLSSVRPVALNLAGPLDQVNTWVSQWGTGAQILGGTILGICAIIVGIQIGTKSVVSEGSSGTGTRQSISKLFQIALAGVVIGAALLLVPMLVNIGKGSGTPAPAEPAAAPTAPA